MSGHSKWSKIKHKKGENDAKKSKIYGKITRMIAVAVREKGSDPDTNPALRLAIEKAREANMPSDTVDRAIKKATSNDKSSLETLLFEMYGPGGVAIIATGITDNSNRTTSEIKHILTKHNAKLGEPGSAKFLFRKTDDGWEPTTTIPVDEKTESALFSLFNDLDDHDDIQDIYSNAEFSSKE